MDVSNRSCQAKKLNQILYTSTCVVGEKDLSMPNMTGRPGCRTMEMNGGSSAPYLARTPCVPLFFTLFNRGGNRRAFRLPGAGGGSLPLYGGTFARSYSVSNLVVENNFSKGPYHPNEENLGISGFGPAKHGENDQDAIW